MLQPAVEVELAVAEVLVVVTLALLVVGATVVDEALLVVEEVEVEVTLLVVEVEVVVALLVVEVAEVVVVGDVVRGNAVPRTSSIQAEPASGNCHTMMPPCHPSLTAVDTQPARVAVSTQPLVASADVPGFPISNLSESTPEAMIWKSAVLGQVLDDAVSRPAQVVYSVAPWL